MPFFRRLAGVRARAAALAGECCALFWDEYGDVYGREAALSGLGGGGGGSLRAAGWYSWRSSGKESVSFCAILY